MIPDGVRVLIRHVTIAVTYMMRGDKVPQELAEKIERGLKLLEALEGEKRE